SQKDKIAMANFPLNWAKFRILYSDASESDRTVLLKKLANADGSRGITVSNRLLEKVLSEKPWREIVLGSKNKSSM
ncbi:MAG: hypothetical protein K8F91_01665, partial [Candidatus Obscuribacterales bacterium]|nr:hypothetical protein [Candidatus Obscuribacterales bacterium]